MFRDLEAASSLIDPASKDSLITSLSKKLKVLKRKLEEVDTEYARNMMIGTLASQYWSFLSSQALFFCFVLFVLFSPGSSKE